MVKSLSWDQRAIHVCRRKCSTAGRDVCPKGCEAQRGSLTPPNEGQTRVGHQLVGGEAGRLLSRRDRGDNIRGKEAQPQARVALDHAVLNFDRAAHGVDHAAELDQRSVADAALAIARGLGL